MSGIGFVAATREYENRLTGHQQVTDAYLLGLAMHKKGKLATMDRGVSELLAERSLEREFVVMIKGGCRREEMTQRHRVRGAALRVWGQFELASRGFEETKWCVSFR
jgi:hypothetical protein